MPVINDAARSGYPSSATSKATASITSSTNGSAVRDLKSAMEVVELLNEAVRGLFAAFDGIARSDGH